MKKMIMVIWICSWCFLFLTYNVHSQTLEYMKININKDEIGILFLNNSNVKALLIHHNHQNELIILEGINQFQFRKEFLELKFLPIHHIYVLTEHEKSKIKERNVQVLKNQLFDGIRMKQKQGYLEINYQNQNLCFINEQDSNIDDCDFLYLNNSLRIHHYSDKTKLLIYDFDIPLQEKLKNYNRWVDTITLSNDSYMMLVWNHLSYETIVIPKKI